VTFPDGPARPVGERPTLVGTVSSLLPASVTMKLARKTIRQYSSRIGHDLAYRLEWR
jgi:hypothetical protein